MEAKIRAYKRDTINGTIIIADKQTNGIGTHERKWYTGKGDNIALTIILYPDCSIKRLQNITRIIAECMKKAIYNLYGIELTIKEPNDLIYNNKKIGGILTETLLNKEQVKYLLIGIGFNVEQTVFPEELTEIATSLKKENNRIYSRVDIIAEFCNEFEKEYIELVKE